MSSAEKKGRKVSRKEFVKGAAMGAAGVAAGGVLASCTPAATPQVIKETVEVPVEVTREVIKEVEVTKEVVKEVEAKPWLPEKWDYEADVVVVGFGMAGAATAITAHDAGADVLVIEKMPAELEGGSSKVSLNIVFIPDNAEDAILYFKKMSEGRLDDIPEEMINVWAEESVKNMEWLTDFGCELTKVRGAEHVKFPGADSMGVWANKVQGNAALWNPVREQVSQRNIKILFSTPAKELIATCDNEVIGVWAEQDGKPVAIKARRGVALTCGGFEFNDTLKDQYLPAPCWGLGCPGNTGDGILMAQKLGADLWHMVNYMGPAGNITFPLGLERLDFAASLFPSAPEEWIWVDKYGNRFMDETVPHLHGHGYRPINFYDVEKAEFPRIPLWFVFDEKLRTRGPILGERMWTWFIHYSGYKWSQDNSAEIEKGWIKKGNTPEELAAQLGVDPGVLANTISTYNQNSVAGNDPFGRPAEKIFPLDDPPYYAVQVYAGMPNTMGGPRRNEKAQIIDVLGKPIKRLYSAGELGSIYPWLYQGGGNLGECMAFGRIAGRNAAAETPWE